MDMFIILPVGLIPWICSCQNLSMPTLNMCRSLFLSKAINKKITHIWLSLPINHTKTQWLKTTVIFCNCCDSELARVCQSRLSSAGQLCPSTSHPFYTNRLAEYEHFPWSKLKCKRASGNLRGYLRHWLKLAYCYFYYLHVICQTQILQLSSKWGNTLPTVRLRHGCGNRKG